MERIAEWLSALFLSTHAAVIGLLAVLTGAWRAVRLILVAAALSSVREETITELRREIGHLRAEVEFYRSHSRVGGNGSASTGTSPKSSNGATPTSK